MDPVGFNDSNVENPSSALSSIEDSGLPEPGYYIVASRDFAKAEGKTSGTDADWLCTPAPNPLPTKRAARKGLSETAAFLNRTNDQASCQEVPKGLLDEGYVAKIDVEGNVNVAWKEMFQSVGISPFEFKLYFETAEEADDDVLAVAYSALTGGVLTESQISLLSNNLLRSVTKLCARSGLFGCEAVSGVNLLAKTPVRKDDDVNRLRYALSLSRTPCRRRAVWFFDAESFATGAARLPSCYGEDLLSLANAVESVCARGERPTVLLKAPDGAPVDEAVDCIVDALTGGDGRYIDVGSVSSTLDLMGCSSSFSGSLPGLVARGMFAHGDLPVVIRNVGQLEKLKKDDGDPVDFVARLCGSGGLPTDAYIGIPMRPANPVILVSGPGRSKLESVCNVVSAIHPLSRSEKIQTLACALEASGVCTAPETAAFVVDNWCFDDGIALMEDAVKAIVQGVPGGSRALAQEDVASLLPAPDRDDPRHLAGRKRALLDGFDERYRQTVDTLLRELEENESPQRSGSLRKLEALLGSIPDGTDLPRLAAEEIGAAISRTHPHMGNVVEISDALAASLRSGTPILFEGPAGTGKTSLSEALAEALGGVPFVKRDFPGMSVQELYGSVGSPSLLTEAVAAFDGKPGVLLIDEVDKPSPLSDRSLLSLLDKKVYADSFLNLPVDLSRWLVVLTANDVESVSPYVRNRVRTVEVPGYTPADKAAIAKEALVDHAAILLGQAPARFSDEALECAASLDDDAGLRAFERRIVDLSLLHSGERVSAADVRAAFPAAPARGMGVRVIMPRGGAKGGAALACVDCQRERGLKKPEVLVGTPAFESCLRLSQLALHSCGISPAVGALASIVETGDSIDGTYCPYAQLGTAVALSLAEAGLSADLPSVAFVGELQPSGEIKAIRPKDEVKIPFIVSRAKAHGVEAIACPAGFQEKGRDFAKHLGVDLMPIATLAQAVDYAKSVQSLDAFLESLRR